MKAREEKKKRKRDWEVWIISCLGSLIFHLLWSICIIFFICLVWFCFGRGIFQKWNLSCLRYLGSRFVFAVIRKIELLLLGALQHNYNQSPGREALGTRRSPLWLELLTPWRKSHPHAHRRLNITTAHPCRTMEHPSRLKAEGSRFKQEMWIKWRHFI